MIEVVGGDALIDGTDFFGGHLSNVKRKSFFPQLCVHVTQQPRFIRRSDYLQ